MAQIRVKILNKADSHDITEILLKVALNTITPSKFEYHSNEVYLLQHYVKKFVSDLQQVSGFLHQ
jgi:hypothetical protein